jgi:flavin reductase (DIM6/NTAB) family NADH-FMN oxidoreductase RutF
MGAFPTGVTVVTTLDADDNPVGLTCNAFASVSAEPPLVLVSLDRTSNTLPALRGRGRFVINFLAAGRDELATRCAGKARDKFVPIPWEPTFHGLPVLRDDSIAHVSCDVVEEVEAGDHILFIGRVIEARPPDPGAVPLLYFRRTFDRWPVIDS